MQYMIIISIRHYHLLYVIYIMSLYIDVNNNICTIRQLVMPVYMFIEIPLFQIRLETSKSLKSSKPTTNKKD